MTLSRSQGVNFNFVVLKHVWLSKNSCMNNTFRTEPLYDFNNTWPYRLNVAGNKFSKFNALKPKY